MADTSDGFIHVQYTHVNSAAENMIEQTRAINTTLNQLEMELNDLKQTWYGSDAEVYTEKQANWDNAVIKMQQLLANHADLLTDVSANYKQTENGLSQLWSEVNIGR
ncbi:WXG100 family type VII secretion target [Streptomyces pakalii]|uniref:ESAT-6-like protein n=1 Tax=Streptomyces pakalii TaxID=3036494 RepID=A0ABT7DD16_9ACTN|nr:WXG100 family type VII secretion target [Streptomyces pakalii]MDJ1642754.1 WXG100 family type VII secretion target [Streptomyces pakalii]